MMCIHSSKTVIIFRFILILESQLVKNEQSGQEGGVLEPPCGQKWE